MGLKESVLAQVNPWQLLTAFRPQTFFHIIRQHFKSAFQRYLQKSQIVSRRHLAGALNGFEGIGTGTSQPLAAAHSLSSANFFSHHQTAFQDCFTTVPSKKSDCIEMTPCWWLEWV
jgi:hypothetical protein